MQNIVISSYFDDTVSYHKEIHFHNEYELICVLDGAAQVTINGMEYTVSKNNLIFISNLEQHSVKQLHPSYKRFCVTLHVPTTDACLQDARLLSILKNHPQNFVHVFDITPFQNAAVRIFQNIISYNTGDEYANDLVLACIMELLALIRKHNPERFAGSHSPAEDKIFKIQQFIDQHFYEDIKIDALSKEFFISNFYLSHKFKELTGLSPKQYLMSVRLKQASLMLLNTDLPVSQIAEKAGFSNHSNFIKSFKSVYQLLPKDFRLNK